MMPAQRIRVKNWSKFQHYKDRSPPWIKLYNELLENYAWSCLQDASKAHLIGIWMLASRSEDDLPADPRWLAGKISASDSVDLTPLVSAGFIEVYDPASNMLADCKRNAIPEGETETESEREKEEEAEPREAIENPTATGVSATTTNGVGADPTEAMLDHLAKHAASMPQDANRRKLVAQARMVATGEDRKAWECPDGSTIPEDERPEIFRLALGYHADGTQRAFRSSVRYACKLYSEPEPDPNLANLPPADRRIAERVMQLRGLDLGSFAA